MPDAALSGPSELSVWQVLENLGEAMAVVDRQYRIVWFKESLSQFLPNPGPKVGRLCYEVLFNRKSPCIDTCPVTPVFADGNPHTLERHFITPDGKEIWREARAYPIVDRQGRVAFVARISFDITHRKLKQKQQMRDQDTLERALSQMSQLQLDGMPFQPSASNALSGRELEVLRLLAQGLSKPQIGNALGISENTVKRHVSNIFDKLGVNDRTQAALWAARQGLA
jgi:DNA-binding CsgD family transcriptional regulator